MSDNQVISSVSFRAKWVASMVPARQVGSVWCFNIDDPFVPANMVYKIDLGGGNMGYGLTGLSDADAAAVLHGSTAVNLLQAYNGINLDLSALARSPGVYTKRFMLTDEQRAAGVLETTDVVEGDNLLVLLRVGE